MTNKPCTGAADRTADGPWLVIEERGGPAEALLDELHAHLKLVPRLGLTGPPGSGKSTLASALATVLRGQDTTVGVLAVDPTSPFTGGALLCS